MSNVIPQLASRSAGDQASGHRSGVLLSDPCSFPNPALYFLPLIMRSLLALTILLAFCCSGNVHADSIDVRIASASSDTARLRIINHVARELVYSDLKRAAELANQGLLLSSKIKDQLELSHALDNLGLVAEHHGDYQKSLSYFLTALRLREKVQNKKAIAISLNNVGVICWYMHKYTMAKEYFHKGMELNQALNDTGGVATILGNLGIISDEEGNDEEALKYYELARKMFSVLGNQQAIASCLSNMGLIYTRQNKLNKAEEVYTEALEIREKNKDPQGVAISLTNIGLLHEKKGDHKSAVRHFRRSLAIAKELQAKEDIRENLMNLSNSFAAQRLFDSAYVYLHQHMSVKDSLMSQETQKSVQELETRYQSEKKEQEISLLRKEREVASARQKSELEKQRLYRNTFMGGMIMMLLMAVTVFSRYQVKKKANRLLQQKNEAISLQKMQIEHAHEELAAKNKDITDSIRYAKRIQESIFPPSRLINKYIPENFILYKPKDIVSGDFYWFEHRNGKSFIAAVDCTGHGVPGSLMSMIGNSILRRAVVEHKKATPSEILDELNAGITESLNQSYEESSVKDGMDIALCCIDHVNKTIEYAGAFNPLWIVRNGELAEIKADKIQVGLFMDEEAIKFRNHKVEVKGGEVFYLFTDGYADQFGGPAGKKFKYKPFAEKLIEISGLPLAQQKDELESTFTSWRGQLEQVDDVLVIGFRI